jgi:hypothetical protein
MAKVTSIDTTAAQEVMAEKFGDEETMAAETTGQDDNGAGYVYDPSADHHDADLTRVIATSDMETIRALLSESQDNERKALKKYMTYVSKHGDKLRGLHSEYAIQRMRTERLFKAATSGLANI